MYLGKRIRIAIVDNDKLALDMMKQMIKQLLPFAEIYWTAAKGKTAIDKCLDKKTQPDVLLVDMSMEDMTGYEVCRAIRSKTPQIVLIGITAFSLERYYVQALENGAACLMDKAQVRDVCQALCLLANGQSPRVKYESLETAQEAYARLSIENSPKRRYKNLTRREEEVMNLCALGYTSKEIGVKLGIGEPTVKTYIKRVVEKIGAKNRTQAVIKWIEKKDE